MPKSPQSNNSLRDEELALTQRPFWFYFKKFKKNCSLGLLALLATNLLDALPPIFIGKAIDQIADGKSFEEILHTVSIIFAIVIGLSIFRYLWRIFWGHFHHSVADDLRRRVFHKYLNLGANFYSKNTVGSLMTLITNDVNAFRMAIGPGVLILFDALYILCIVPPLMYSISPDWTWKTLILLPLVPFASQKILHLIHSTYKVQQERFSELSGNVQEIASGIRVIKGFAQELNHTLGFNQFSKRYEDSCNKVAKVDAFFTPMMELSVTAGCVILLLVGSPEVIGGGVTIGLFFSFYQYIQRMVWPATAIGISVSQIQQGKASFKRIIEILEEPVDIPDTGSIIIDSFEKLEVKGLTFTYPGEETPQIKDLSFSVKKGEALGIVGSTGSGKSTLAQLITRLYPVERGSVFINGHDINDITLESLRKIFAVSPQETFLFSRSIEDNVALGALERIQEVPQFAKLVNIHDEILEIEHSYKAQLGERGVNLSGGQKQRLAIARSMIRNSPVLILDDSLSAVDSKTESNILSRLKGTLSERSDVTSIIISHRLSSIDWADKILVLQDGKMEALGSHDSLINDSVTYRHVYELQRETGSANV